MSSEIVINVESNTFSIKSDLDLPAVIFWLEKVKLSLLGDKEE